MEGRERDGGREIEGERQRGIDRERGRERERGRKNVCILKANILACADSLYRGEKVGRIDVETSEYCGSLRPLMASRTQCLTSSNVRRVFG